MKKFGLLLVFVSLQIKTNAQTNIHSRVINTNDSTGIGYVQIYNQTQEVLTTSNENGYFKLEGLPSDTILFVILGYKKQTFTINQLSNYKLVALKPSVKYLEAITVQADQSENIGVSHIDKLTLKLKPVGSAQDLLTTMDGVFIAQHAGGGKAEQIFLRGFDNDHGTDFAVYIDDVPINLSSHAHGQGYADMHFIIPEMIQDADYYRGTYEAQNGNFAVSGAARYKTAYALTHSTAKLDVGQYGFQRGLLSLNLTPKNKLLFKNKNENAYIAVEGTLNEGVFDAPQDFKKLSSMLKYNAELTPKTYMSLSAFHFTSSWDASGQIPFRAVQDGTIGWFGAIDDTEGGSTSRLIASIKTSTELEGKSKLNNHLYYSNNQYQLYSNFTFYLNDPVNGDMIEQLENRNIFGYAIEHEREGRINNTQLNTSLSAGFRGDFLDSELRTAVERTPLESQNKNTIQEINTYLYGKANWILNKQWLVQFGARLDMFHFDLSDQLDASVSGTRQATRFSPKLSIFYNPTENWQLFAKAGQGFHSTYTQAAVGDQSISPLPKASAADLGTQFKIGKRLISTFTLWTIQSEAEYIFVADAGEFENNGTSLRRGFDFSTKFNPLKNLWLNTSVNYSKGILLDNEEGNRTIPSAPVLTLTSSVSYKYANFDFYIGARYLGERSLTEDESVIADDYLVIDPSIYYSYRKFQIGLSIQNLLNTEWMEAVFYDQSRLIDEIDPVEDFHFTPGTPRFTKLSLSYNF